MSAKRILTRELCSALSGAVGALIFLAATSLSESFCEFSIGIAHLVIIAMQWWFGIGTGSPKLIYITYAVDILLAYIVGKVAWFVWLDAYFFGKSKK